MTTNRDKTVREAMERIDWHERTTVIIGAVERELRALYDLAAKSGGQRCDGSGLLLVKMRPPRDGITGIWEQCLGCPACQPKATPGGDPQWICKCGRGHAMSVDQAMCCDEVRPDPTPQVVTVEMLRRVFERARSIRLDYANAMDALLDALDKEK